jgi:tRNA U34 2-thiouridine synthase MnmA/TrmU
MAGKAIALISGGLDSLLAARVVMDQGIEVKGVAFVMTAATRDASAMKRQIERAAEDAGVPVEVIDISKGFLEIIKDPRHGFGANVNPCIDCKIYMLRKAKQIMEKEKGDLIVTGEVLGERPMSQNRRSLDIIEKEAGVEGLLLRPLSARCLEETLPEKKGLIDRSRLLAIQGRSRKPQIALAEKYDITEYSAPGTSCLLTDPRFSSRVRDLLERDELDMRQMDLLKAGRHYRLDSRTKAVVGRDREDNSRIRSMKKEDDILLRLEGVPGPDVLLTGDTTDRNIEKAASLAVYHSKMRGRSGVRVSVWKGKREKRTIKAGSATGKMVDSLRI